MTTESKTFNVFVTRLFDAPVEQVWQAWSDSEQVRRWWGPHGFTCPLARMDFREGGASLVCMRTPGGHDLYNTWTYSKIIPHQRIEFVQRFSDQDGNQQDPNALGLPPGIPMQVPHVVTFKSTGTNQTEMTVTEFGYPSPEVVAMSQAGLDECLEKMAQSFQE